MSATVTAMPSHREPLSDAHEQRALGFWLYLMGDAVLFGLLFMTYGIMVGNIAGGPSGKTLFSLNNAALETALLLVSSTTFGFASLSSKAGSRSAVLSWLLLTFVLGAGFVFLEVREFLGLIRAGAGPDRSGFLSAFFTLVATHGLPPSRIMYVIAAAAVLQILVHLRFFLHLSFTTTPRENLLAIAFTTVLLFLMVGGSLWIMIDL